jgi:glutamate-ammonia-ligase adenylyltransferase
MALSRARLVAGDESLRAQAEKVIDRVLSTPGDQRKITADVVEMRAMIEEEKPPKAIWDVKLIPGGLVDIEFIAQYLTLIAPGEGISTQGRNANTEATLRHFGPHFLAAPDLYTVLGALRLFSEMAQVVRLCIDGAFDPKDAPEGLKELICNTTELPDLKVLEGELKRYSLEVRTIFRNAVG